eukprot:TRINITY_DN6757_c1_g1_i1.p1 TRINITY_DN6757_c1_g1~~TRINITY_DN6757_c1_g1_i1.p1  ORF type:complete len:326 (+),score=60.79 TRINITY_DN6757_c1_g1_i1:70-1047(+)
MPTVFRCRAWQLFALIFLATVPLESAGEQPLEGCFSTSDGERTCCCIDQIPRPPEEADEIRQTCFKGRFTFEACCAGSTVDCTAPSAANSAVSTREIRTTQDYWELRYKIGGSSRGLVGDSDTAYTFYEYRTEVLRQLFESGSLGGSVASVLDMGVGDGLQAGMLLSNTKSVKKYVGIDLSHRMVRELRRSFEDNLKKNGFWRPDLEVAFYGYDGYTLPAELGQHQFDIALSLQVIMHLLEDALFDSYMTKLFDPAASWRHVIIQADNVQTAQYNHIRGWRFTDWIAEHAPMWVLRERYVFEEFLPREIANRPGDALWIYSRVNV